MCGIVIDQDAEVYSLNTLTTHELNHPADQQASVSTTAQGRIDENPS